MKMILFVAALAVAGCSKKSSSSSACSSSIGKSVDNMMAQGKARMKAMRDKLPPDQQKMLDDRAAKFDEIATKMKDVMAKDCVDQKWSSDVLKCFDTAANREDIQKCQGMLPPDQGQKLKADVMQVMMSAMGGMGGMHGGLHAMPPGGAPAAGSATPEGGSAGGAMGGAGSAAAGSAAAPATPPAPAPAGSGK